MNPSSEEYAVLEWVEADFKKLQAMWNDALSDAAERFNAEEHEQKKTTGDEIKRSIKKVQRQTAQSELTKAYHKTVDQIMNGQYGKSDAVLIGYTPEIYQRLGMPSLPFVIGPGHVYSIAKTKAEAIKEKRYSKNTNYHGLGISTIKDILKNVSDPIMVISSKDINQNTFPIRSRHSVVAIININIDGESTITPIEITAERTMNGNQYDVNVLSSAYKRDVKNLVAEAIAEENIGKVGVFYLKKEASALLADGVQFPKRLIESLASDGIIHDLSEKVNLNLINSVQSLQFIRWFGDWQNHPENSSKIINGDGSPKVMYRGTEKEARRGLHAMWKANCFFSRKLNRTERQNAGLEPVYLNIKNPFVHDGNRNFVEQVTSTLNLNRNIDSLKYEIHNHGYDGVIQYDDNGEISAAVIFESNQVKSATDNIGTFDGSNSDIRYSLRRVAPTSREILDQVFSVDLSNDNDLLNRVTGLYGAKKYKEKQRYILETLNDQPLTMSDGRKVVVDNSDALHIANKAATKKTAEIGKIKELVEKAELYAEDKNVEHNKFNYFCYYVGNVKYGNEQFPIYLNVGRGKNDGKYHLYDITNKIRDTADRINGLERPKPNEGYALTNGISTDTVPQNETVVNTYYMSERKNHSNSKESATKKVKLVSIPCGRKSHFTMTQAEGIIVLPKLL